MEAYIVGLIRSFKYLGVLAGMMIEQISFVVPSEMILADAAILLSKNALTLSFTILAGIAGTVLGASILYAIGRYIIAPLTYKVKKYFLVTDKDLAEAKGFINEYGFLFLIVCRSIPIVRNLISLPMGMAKASYKKFVLCSAIGSIPWTLSFALAGYYLGNNWIALSSYINALKLPAIAILGAGAVWFVYSKLTKPVTKMNVEASTEKEKN